MSDKDRSRYDFTGEHGRLRAQVEIQRDLWTKTGNPLHVSAAYSLLRSAGIVAPTRVLEYFDDTASDLLRPTGVAGAKRSGQDDWLSIALGFPEGKKGKNHRNEYATRTRYPELAHLVLDQYTSVQEDENGVYFIGSGKAVEIVLENVPESRSTVKRAWSWYGDTYGDPLAVTKLRFRRPHRP